MSSYLSRPYQEGRPSPLPNVDIVRSNVRELQTKYDQNQAIIESTIAKFDMIKLLRPEENEYLAGRLIEAQSAIDAYSQSNGDLSRNTTRDTMLSAFKGIYKDPIILNAIEQKTKFDNLNAEVAKIKEKGDGSYSDVNYQYSIYKGGVQDYMQGKTKKLGDLSYVPYVDLTEEHLKKLKTIKDIKGKRVIETPEYDINGQPTGRLISKSIDGLTPTEIQNYFGGIITSQELNQMKINGWAKYAQPETKDIALEKYKELTNLTLKQKEEEYKGLITDSKNPNKDAAERDKALKLSNELKETIDGLKSIDYSKIDTLTIGFELEKANYKNSLSQIAGAEWSTESKVDQWYFDTQNLDIKKQELELAKKKESREAKVDKSGNPILEDIISITPASTELSETLSEKEAGAGTLKSVHDKAYQQIVKTAREFLLNATDEEKELFEGYLDKRGITPNLQFKDKSNIGKNSLVNSIYEAFKDGGFNQTSSIYAKDMQSAYKIKQESAKNIIKADTYSYSEEFNKNPEEYTSKIMDVYKYASSVNFNTSSNEFSKMYENITGKKIDKLGLEFATGSWLGSTKKYEKEIEEAIKKDPKKAVILADTMETLREVAYKDRIKNTVIFGNTLKDNAKQIKEEWIKKRTDEGVMMSAYTQSNILDEKVRSKIIGSVSEGEITLEDGKTKVNARFDPKNNLTVSREGENVVIRQVNEVDRGEGNKKSNQIIKYVLNPQSSAYAELSKYIDFQVSDGRNIKATKNTEFEEVKPQMRYHTDTKDVRDKKVTAVALNFSPQLAPAFSIQGIPPIKLASALSTKDTAEGVIELLLTNKGIDEGKAKQYTQKILEKINTYKLKVKSQNNLEGTGYDFAIEVKKQDGSLLFRRSLGVGVIDTKTDYLLDNYPQIFILNQKIQDVLEEPNRIDTLINEL